MSVLLNASQQGPSIPVLLRVSALPLAYSYCKHCKYEYFWRIFSHAPAPVLKGGFLVQLNDRANPDNPSTCRVISDFTLPVRTGTIRVSYHFRIESKSSVISCK